MGDKVEKRSYAVAEDDPERRIFVRAGDAVPVGFKLEGAAPALAPTPAPVPPDEPDEEEKSSSAASNKAKPKPADKGASS